MTMSNPTPPHLPLDTAATPLARGASIGRYVVLGLVGRGGMGEVYAAYDPELDRKVAVKLLRVKADNGVTMTEGRQRTLREAQAIARLSHPNVVVAYDVGTFEDKVFIAMEFVEGNTVTFWLEQQPRTWQEVLRIFIAAGRGLIAAHEKGLVHRDFKPDNVMVGRDGQVRVMDFGLARQMPEKPTREHRPRPVPASRGEVKVGTGTLPLDQGTLVLNQGGPDVGEGSGMHTSTSGLFDARLTRTGAMMGTPAYMAPEQFFGKDTDARTDQFSFCVSLYEALYGERPFPGKKLSELTANVVQGTVRAAPTGTKVPFWVRKILLRGLRSAPAERYPSMGELLEELGKDPRAKRRKWAVGAAVALMPLAVGLGVRQTLVEQRAVCEGAPEKLAGIWELHAPDKPEGPRQSQIHAAFLRTGKSYAADVWETVSRALTGYAQSWAGMYKDTCEATNVRHEQSAEVLDLRMACLQERLAGFRALTDVFAEANGEVVENAVSATNALNTLDRCADVPTLRAVIRLPDDPKVVAEVGALRRQLAKTKAQFDAGRWKETLKLAPQLVSAARTISYQPLTAESLGVIGLVEAKANDGRAAEKALIEAYRLADGSRHDEVRAEAATDLIYVVGVQEGRFDDAIRWSDLASSVLQRLGGHELLQAWLLNNVGCAYYVHGEGKASVKELEAASALKQKVLGPDHPDVGLTEGNIGTVLEEIGRNDEAIVHEDRAIAILQAKLGAAHPEVAPQLSNRGETLNALGRYKEALQSFERAATIWERELGPDAAYLAYPLTGIGLSYLAENKPDNAIVALRRALKIREGVQTEPRDMAETMFALARALWAANREHDQAKQLAEQARSSYARASIDGKLKEAKLKEVDDWLHTRQLGTGLL
ncbi:MAG TPA: serine/threonine-protein kinase [Polyangia bacterium]|nr:serine/threonine-protein kinase [Polyangia bacterium]